MGVVLAVKVLEQVAGAMPNEVPPSLFTMRMDGHGSDGSKEMTAGQGDLNPKFTRSYCVAGCTQAHAESPGGTVGIVPGCLTARATCAMPPFGEAA